jgi:hypothetical protein
MNLRTTTIEEDGLGKWLITLKMDGKPISKQKTDSLNEAQKIHEDFIREGASDTRVLLNENK